MSRDQGTEAGAGFPYRFIYLALALVTMAAIALGVAFGRGGEPALLPLPIEALHPLPNDATLAQAVLEVDLQVGYRADIYIDGFPVPGAEVTYVEATGVHRWQPVATSLVFDRWAPGEHVIRIVWDTLAGLPSPGEFTWTFRVQ
ncbi:MAG TPA: hypothetical protein VLA54_03325 [Acidimicrobiia bacterium]|nr:hypothetical protein [Acidimicrobiia bacterium]